MTMPTLAKCSGLLTIAGLLVLAIGLSGCPSAEKKSDQKQTMQQTTASPTKSSAKTAAESQAVPKAKEQPVAKPEAKSEAAAAPKSLEKDLAEELEQVAEKPRDLGAPLVDQPDKLVRLDPEQPVWIDKEKGQIVLLGEVCRAGYPLEFFATYSNRSYEAVMSVNVKPSMVHAALLTVGAEPGHPAQFQPEFVAPTGTEVAIEVRWKDEKGKTQSSPAQQWIRNIKTKKALDSNWVFAGSMFVKDETTGKEYYQADSGELICVLSLSTAMLDLPIRGYGALEARSFEAFAEHLPTPGTPTTILLKPILPGKPGKPSVDAKPAESLVPPLDAGKRAEAEAKALEAAEPWLALVDQGQYTQNWQTAAELLKDRVDRRDFVKSLGDMRKPLGKVKSRELQSKLYATSLPRAPDGQYVVIQYETAFEKKASAVETITLIQEGDNKWTVSEYDIQ